MRSRLATLPPVALVAVGLGGCGGGSDAAQPAGTPASRSAADGSGPVSAEIDLARPPAGSPDGGQPAGHEGGGPEGAVRGSSFAFRGRVRPAGARLMVRAQGAATASVTRSSGGGFLVRVSDLRPGANRFALTATAPARAPWREQVTIRRLGSADEPTEPQAAEPERGSPGAAEPSGGKVDVD